MMVGGSYRSCPNFTAGNDVEPGMFCGQAAARGATYRLRRVGEMTDIFQICRIIAVMIVRGFYKEVFPPSRTKEPQGMLS